MESLPANPPSDRAEQIRLLNEFIRLQAGIVSEGIGIAPEAAAPHTARGIIARTGLRRYAETAGVSVSHLSEILRGKRTIPSAWLQKLGAANRKLLEFQVNV